MTMIKIKWEWTIPNLLSLFRILLIPAMAASYLTDCELWVPALFLVLSGLTDLFDGAIARRFDQVSEIGKLLDPLADKLTQFTVVVCLAVNYPSLWWLVAIVFVKELLQAIGGFLLINKLDGEVTGAKWFGKATTVLFYVVMVALVVFPEMSETLQWSMIGAVAVCMICTFFGYLKTYFSIRKDAEK